MRLNEKSDIKEHQKTIAWLLDSPTPSIRYLTLTHILGKPEADAEVQAARRSIITSNPAKNILNRQQAEGFWIKKKYHYSPKYRSSHWSMGLLCELGVDPDLPAMQTGAAFMLEKMEKAITELKQGGLWCISCFWGNWLRYQLYCGNFQDQRVQKVIQFLIQDIHRKSQCRYNYNLPCSWGVIRALYGLALIPEKQRSAQINTAIQTGLKFLLEDHDLLKANYPVGEGKIHELWSKLSFPLFYQADILSTLRVVKELNALHHPQAAKAQDWLQTKRTQQGIWQGGNPFGKRTWPVLAENDTISRWITLHALNVLS